MILSVKFLSRLFIYTLILISPALSADPNWKAYEKLSLRILSDLIEIDTSNPPGNELAAAKYLSKLFRKEGIKTELFLSDYDRANLVARCRGDKSKKPFMIIAHTDVVGIEGQAWNTPPFEAVVKDGYLYGRGALDNKGMLALGATVLIMLKREKTPLARDVILFASVDEESGGGKGVRWMLRRHPKKIRADFALNEGGRIFVSGDTVNYVAVAIDEKVTYNARIIATGRPGHSSVPHENNAVYRLAAALVRLDDLPMPTHLTPTTREFFAGLAPFDPDVSYDPVKDSVETPIRRYRAMLSDTFVPTMLNASFKSNVLPDRAEAVVNYRLLPDTDPESFFAYIMEAVGADSTLMVEYVPRADKTPPPSPTTLEFYRAIRRVASEFWPNALFLPTISTGSTDSGKLRRAGIPTYGLLPFPLSGKDSARMHGPDERIKIDDYYTGLRFLYELTLETAGKEPE